MIELIKSWLTGGKQIKIKDNYTFTSSSKRGPEGFCADLEKIFVRKEHSAMMTEDLRFSSEDCLGKPNPILTFLFSSKDPKGHIYEPCTVKLSKRWMACYKFNKDQAAKGFGNLEAKVTGVNKLDKPGCIEEINKLSPNKIPCLRADFTDLYKSWSELPEDELEAKISEDVAKLEAATGREFRCIQFDYNDQDYYALVELIPFEDIDIELAIRIFMCSSVPFDLAAEVVLATGSKELRTALGEALANCTRDKFFEDCKIADGFSTRFQTADRPLLVDRLIQIFRISGDVYLVRKLIDWKDKYHEDDIETPVEFPKENDLEIKFNEFEENSLEVEGELAVKKIGWGE